MTRLSEAPGPRLRPGLAAVPGYVPGRSPAAAAGLPAHKLSSNENPFPPLPSVLEAVRDRAAEFNRYPDMAVAALTSALAERFGLTPESVATGTGSVAVLGQVLAAVAGPGDEVVFAWRSFEAYPIVVRVSGATPVPVPLRPDDAHDLDAMAGAITPRTRLIILCTPNNPTGTAIGRAELDRFLDRVPEDVLVVVDEAYREFVTDPLAADGAALAAERGNVAVLRTFSKAYGLAGLRIGYALARPAAAEALRNTAVPFGVTALAEAAALASLAAEDELLDRVRRIVDQRERVLSGLRGDGWTVRDSQANFVWLRTGALTPSFAEHCAAAGVAVRPFGQEGVRVTVGDPAGNDAFLAAAANWPDRPR